MIATPSAKGFSTSYIAIFIVILLLALIGTSSSSENRNIVPKWALAGSTGITSGSTTSGGGYTLQTKEIGTCSVGSTGGEQWGTPPYGQWFSGSVGGTGRDATGDFANSVTAKSSGSVTFQVTWTGTGTAPTSVWVSVSTTANYATAHGSGSCTDAFGDTPQLWTTTLTNANGQPVTVTGSQATSKRIFQLALTNGVGTTPTYSISATATDQGNSSGVTASCTVSIALESRSATLARSDGGTATLGSNGAYTADTLLSWNGTDDFGNEYTNPGPTSQTITGAYAGTWTQHLFPTSGGGTVTLDYTKVDWSGSSAGNSTLQTPNPANIRSTTYTGQMPEETDAGQKTQTWTYKVTDLGDGAILPLTLAWTCHHVHENWVDSGTGANLQTSLPTGVSATLNSPGATTTQAYQFGPETFLASTIYDVSISAGFPVYQRHIGIAAIRSAWGQTINLIYGSASPQTFTFTVDDNNDLGLYKLFYYANQPFENGTVDIWSSQGTKVTSEAQFGPATSAYISGPVAKYQKPEGGAE